MKKATLKKDIKQLLDDNKDNLENATGYDKGYAEGYHDALVDVMHKCDIETEEEYFN